MLYVAFLLSSICQLCLRLRPADKSELPFQKFPQHVLDGILQTGVQVQSPWHMICWPNQLF